ncbi:MAG: S1 family peptidase [Gammaproteobacteria bacterium]|nr:S1 family peptidase [Gammaproteobacteria bacterium]
MTAIKCIKVELKMLKSFIVIAGLLVTSGVDATQKDSWSDTVSRVTSSIVTIRIDAPKAFDTATNNSSQATGFVVDAKRGLILTNRHVVQSGPVTAEAIFSNREEVELKPVYRDPVHDFGFFQYDPEKLKFIKPVSLRLVPEKAKVGSEIRVIGNDAGEQLSILAGTLARLDRGAPYYGRGRYNDFNTFYYQSASGVSGGSSGSPIIDIEGNVLALNAGGTRNAAASFFLPLERVVRVLKRLQNNQTIPRGTLQTTLVYKPYDEIRRLGLRAEVEAQLRKVNHGVGMLVISRNVPGGPADGILRPGDILLKAWVEKQSPQWIRRFDEFESLLDENVGKKIFVQVERNGKEVKLGLEVGDLHAITPDRYLEFGEAIVHDLSYQQARHLNIPVAGVYVAQPGFLLSTAGVPYGAVILQVDNKTVKNIKDMEAILDTLEHGRQVSVRYITFKESMRTHVAIFNMDRRWFPASKCYRDDVTGYWPCENLAEVSDVKKTKIASIELLKYKDSRANRLSASIVYVQFDMPYHVDGTEEAHYGGAGLVVDAENGLVLVDRNTVPVAMGDVRVIVAGAVDIPARVVFIHPTHNMAMVQYDPDLLGDTQIKSASLKKGTLEPGDDIWLVGIKNDQRLIVEPMTIASIEPLSFSIPKVPEFRETNLDVVNLNNAPYTHGGVLSDEWGNVRALWSSFSFGNGDELKQHEWGVPIEMVDELLKQWACCKEFKVHSLDAELSALSIAQARKLGLSDAWLKKFQDTDGKQQVLAVSRLTAGSDAYNQLQVGDLVIAVDDEMVRNFRDVEKRIKHDEVELTIIRSAMEIKLRVKVALLGGIGTDHIVLWNGAVIQNPHRTLAVQRGIKSEGVYVSFIWHGSPASRNGLAAVSRIVELDGRPVKDLDHFMVLAKEYKDKKYIQLKILDLINRESIITLKQDARYWPANEVKWTGDHWLRSAW